MNSGRVRFRNTNYPSFWAFNIWPLIWALGEESKSNLSKSLWWTRIRIYFQIILPLIEYISILIFFHAHLRDLTTKLKLLFLKICFLIKVLVIYFYSQTKKFKNNNFKCAVKDLKSAYRKVKRLLITPNLGLDFPPPWVVVLRCSCWKGAYKTTPEGSFGPAAPPTWE